MDNPVTLMLQLPTEVVKQLETEADNQKRPVNELIYKAIKLYMEALNLHDENEMEDTPDEEILADLRQSLREFQTGQTRPIEELFNEVRELRKHDS